MNEDNTKLNQSARFKLISVILPIANLALSFLGLYFSPNNRMVDILSSLAYIACFDFIYLFYIEVSNKINLEITFTPLLCVLSPVMCFFSATFRETVFIMIICTIFLVLISGLVSFSLSTIILLGVSGFSALFMNDIFVEIIPYLIFLFLICLTTEQISDIHSLIFASFSELIFFFIVKIVASGFVIIDIFTIENILICLISILISGVAFLLKKLMIPTNIPVLNVIPNNSELINSDNVNEILIDTDKSEPDKNSVISDIIFKEMEETVKQNNAMIFSLQEQLKSSNDKYRELEDNFRRLAANTDCRISTLISPDYSYSVKLKGKLPKLFHHCMEIARLSSEAAELINCNSELAFTIGLYHEYSRFLGENGYDQLINEYHVPVYIIKLIDQIKDKSNSSPIAREAGIVLLSDDIINTANYVRNSKNDEVSFERIVNNTFRVRKDQNFLRLSGLSNEEVQLLKLYYSDIGGSNDTSD